jgi:hypothetical protein
MDQLNPKSMNDILTEKEVCDLLQIKKAGLSRLRLEKKLPFCNLTKFNRVYLVSDILEFLVSKRIVINKDA